MLYIEYIFSNDFIVILSQTVPLNEPQMFTLEPATTIFAVNGTPDAIWYQRFYLLLACMDGLFVVWLFCSVQIVWYMDLAFCHEIHTLPSIIRFHLVGPLCLSEDLRIIPFD